MWTLKQGALTNAGINWAAVRRELGPATPRNAAVEEGDILLASTAHEIYYVGREVDLVREMPAEIRESNQAVAEFMIIRPMPTRPVGISDAYVAAFLRHPAGLHQVQRCIRGLRGGHTYPIDIGKFVLVPRPADQWMTTFHERWLSAEQVRREAAKTMANSVRELEAWLTESGANVSRESA